MTSEEIQKAFAKPFGLADMRFLPKNVKGDSALAMPYISARAVQDRLDEVVGVQNWQDEYHLMPDGSVMCQLKVRINGEWVMKSDVGSMSEQPDQGDKLKAAFSDSLKRAAVKYGIGRFLYRLPPVWAKYDSQKRQFSETPRLPDWVLNGLSAPATTQPAQRQPQAQQTHQPQQQRPQQTPPQQQPQGDATAGAVSALTSSASVGELKAAMDVAKLHIQNGRIGDDGKGKVAEAVRSRLLNMVRECQSKPQLDAFFAEYTKLVVPVVTEGSKTHADVREAANAKLALLEANNTENVDLFA